MIKLSTRDATMDDLYHVSNNMRDADIAEVYASSGRYPWEALLRGFKVSTLCKAIVVDDVPIAIYGASETSKDVAAVWMLGTDDIIKYARPWLRQSKEAMDELHDVYPMLYSFVDARNEVHIKWLRWVGYTFVAEHKNYGHGQLPFYEIVRIK